VAKIGMMQADFFQAVVWGPGELPLAPGEPYAIRFVRADGGTFSVYGTSDDYAAGRAYFDGVPDGAADLSGRLIIQEADKGDIALSHLTFTPVSSTEAAVSFETDVPSTATVVYRLGTPIFDSMVAADPVPSTAHQVVVRHLNPNTAYQMSVMAHHPSRNVTRTVPVPVTTLNARDAIIGQVLAGAGPLSGAKVILEQTGQSILTDAQGHFSLADVPTGRHTLQIEAVAHRTVTRDVDVPPAGLTLADVRLDEFTNLLAGSDNDPLVGWTKYGEFGGQWDSGAWTVNARTGPKWVGSVGNADPKTGGIYRTIPTDPGKL
jgi:hypothetical protein